MAKKTHVILVSDISGEEIADGGRTVHFTWKNTPYTIDLTDKEAERFEEAIQPYLDAATKVGRRSRGRGSSGSGKRDNKAIRGWANANGHNVGDRGRIPASIVEEYEAAH